MDPTTFTTTYYPMAQKAGERFAMPPEIILAQAAIESGWGKSYGARVRRNFFGITAAGPTNPYWDGSYSVANNAYALKFRVYQTEQDSFYDFARLISSAYKDAHAVAHDPAAYARAIAYSPYISEKNGDKREGYRTGILSTFRTISEVVKKKGWTS